MGFFRLEAKEGQKMADAYTGEIRIFAGNYAPRDWAFCDGSTLLIQQHAVLYSVIGNRFGGDGKTDFKLPDLRGKAPMHYGTGTGLTTREFAKDVGVENVTLSNEQLPVHKHVLQGSSKTTGGDSSPEGAVWSAIGGFNPKKIYKEFTANTKVNIHQQAIGTTGGNLPHNNMQPYVALNFIICLYGEYPVNGE